MSISLPPLDLFFEADQNAPNNVEMNPSFMKMPSRTTAQLHPSAKPALSSAGPPANAQPVVNRLRHSRPPACVTHRSADCESAAPPAGSARCVARLALALLCLVAFAPLGAQAQATANPPERPAYQGFVTDGNGATLATRPPKNYDIIFRIWNDSSASAAANRLWTPQQTVT